MLLTLWDGVEKSEKISKTVVTGLSKADVLIGVSYALEDFTYNDYICGMLAIIGSVSMELV